MIQLHTHLHVKGEADRDNVPMFEDVSLSGKQPRCAPCREDCNKERNRDQMSVFVTKTKLDWSSEIANLDKSYLESKSQFFPSIIFLTGHQGEDKLCDENVDLISSQRRVWTAHESHVENGE